MEIKYGLYFKVISLISFLLKIGTSGLVYPAAAYGYKVSLRQVPIAEFNVDKRSSCDTLRFYLFLIRYFCYIY